MPCDHAECAAVSRRLETATKTLKIIDGLANKDLSARVFNIPAPSDRFRTIGALVAKALEVVA